ncbi:MAG: SAM-dependent DNA methyltransferase [Calditrichaeota bacterium]|nr:MAG: SAM-dependent DNA methyltransferase [Calditrichota bacterium]
MARKHSSSGAALGFEGKLWAAADKLRGNMDAAEYKHVVLGLIFLKYISDAFMEKFTALQSDDLADPEDKDEYLAENIFWVPPEARWDYLQKNAKRPEIGTLVDNAMAAIERDNRSLKGVLPKDFSRPNLDKARLGEIIDLIATIGLGDKESRQRDILGRVYEYFLARFAAAEGKNGGQFYTPACVVRLLVEMIEPYKGRVFDPCCGSGGMFVSAVKFVQAHASGNGNGKSRARVQRDISIYGQESNYTTWRLALMNLAIRGIDANIQWGDSLLDDKHKDLKADFILANPPFNMEDWGYSKVKDDPRWRRFDQSGGNAQFSLPPGGKRKQKDGSFIHVDGGNANYAWILHFLHHLAPQGTAGFVLANGSLTSDSSGEGEIRKAIIEADLVDCIIALPGQLFYTTQIPACLWFLTRNKGVDKKRGFRDRRGETLFIDARKKGTLIDRKHRDLSEDEILEIAGIYHAWRGEKNAGNYEDKPGFCKAATLKDIRAHGHVLTPGRYVGAEEVEDDGEPFEEKMAALSAELYKQMKEAQDLDAVIRRNLKALGYGE